jgi:extracellular elastinolytic metalloproteinase
MTKLFTIIATLFALAACASNTPDETIIEDHLTADIAKDGFVPQFRITNTVATSTGAQVLYGVQTYLGIDVFQANFVMTFDEEEVLEVNQEFIVNIETLIPSEQFGLSALDALNVMVKSKTKVASEDVKELFTGFYELRNTSMSDEIIKLQKLWVLVGRVVVPAYNVSIYDIDHKHWFNTRIDASNGALLSQNDWVVSCQLHSFDQANATHLPYAPIQTGINSKDKKSGSSSYNVFAMPIESPNHGVRSIEIDPDDADASPFGWHDINGATGPEYSITRGNNVYASEDKDDDNAPGNSPDGGSTLTFSSAFDKNKSAALYTDASIINLFYWNNILHDVWWHYGFDEQSGNFQVNNYGNGGLGNDHVNADAQDGSGTNNANMATPPDGVNPRMQMFLWNAAAPSDYFQVNTPTSIEGKKSSNIASFGPRLTGTPITGKLVLVQDGSLEPDKGCQPLTNATAVNGNIAFVERRGCNFTEKVKNAQNAGAIAVVIYSDDNTPRLMGGTDNTIIIPSLIIGNTDGMALKNVLATQVVTVSLYDSSTVTASTFDSDFDNGVIAHEFGHGISNRLTGGPASSNCLSNEEQMGEGWSDFFGLVMTHKPGDSGTDSRGIGTYVSNEAITGGGIRPYPYSTSITNSPYTYDKIKTFSVPHGVGSVWCSMLWDLYWAMIGKYGYDADIYRGTGGNNIVIQLVIDALKLQKCNPGFEDARDAILQADALNNNGENELLIWQVFARRGLGADADQGSSDSRSDGKEDFSIPEYLLQDIVLSKTAPREADTDSSLTYIISAANKTQRTIQNIILRDTLDDNVTLDISSLSCGATFADGILTYTIDSLKPNDSLICTYTVVPNFNESTSVVFKDDIENGRNNWLTNASAGANGFVITSARKNSGSNSWYALNEEFQSDYILSRSLDLTDISNPVLSFSHWYITEKTWDGGVVEIRLGGTWTDARPFFIENGYNDEIQINPASAISGRNAFTGNSDTFIRSIIDLSLYAGQSIDIRFRMVSDGGARAEGWYIDDVKIIDAVTLSNFVTATYNFNRSQRSGVSSYIYGTKEDKISVEALARANWKVYPNPANDFIRITPQSSVTFTYELQSLTGRVLSKSTASGNVQIDTKTLSTGVYLLRVAQPNGILANYKVVIE